MSDDREPLVFYYDERGWGTGWNMPYTVAEIEHYNFLRDWHNKVMPKASENSADNLNDSDDN